MKAVLINDKELPEDSIEYNYPHTKLTQFKDNVKYKTISAALRTPIVGKYLNRYMSNKAASSGNNRPNELSCMDNYASYGSLTDYSYYGRHLKPASKEYLNGLPPIDEVAKLFARIKSGSMDVQIMCPKSTMLFPTFAQHLIDSFIVTDVKKNNSKDEVQYDWKKTGSPNDIGLLPLYGKTKEQTSQLRLKSEVKGMKGRLKTQIINGGEWSPFLYDANGKKKEEFDTLPNPEGLEFALSLGLEEGDSNKAKKSTIFAFGGSRTNLVPNIAAWNILLLREHNYIANKIENSNPEWDDERVFQTARNVNLVQYLRLVIEEYINHITAYGADFNVDPGKWMWNAPWYKRNWISAEFAVLYRWHAIIPNCMKWGDKTLFTTQYLYSNNLLLDDDGVKGDLREAFLNISDHRATSMQIHNTEEWMVGRDKRALQMSRACELRSFTEYCAYLGMDVPKTFADITSDVEVQNELKALYGNVENIEFWVGLIAKDNSTEAIMSDELTLFVANDAFNQALTHPLLSEHVWSAGPETFSQVGWEMVSKVPSIKDMLQRNTGGAPIDGFVGMTNPHYKIPLSEFTTKILWTIFIGLVVMVLIIIK